MPTAVPAQAQLAQQEHQGHHGRRQDDPADADGVDHGRRPPRAARQHPGGHGTQDEHEGHGGDYVRRGQQQ